MSCAKKVKQLLSLHHVTEDLYLEVKRLIEDTTTAPLTILQDLTKLAIRDGLA